MRKAPATVYTEYDSKLAFLGWGEGGTWPLPARTCGGGKHDGNGLWGKRAFGGGKSDEKEQDGGLFVFLV